MTYTWPTNPDTGLVETRGMLSLLFANTLGLTESLGKLNFLYDREDECPTLLEAVLRRQHTKDTAQLIGI